MYTDTNNKSYIIIVVLLSIPFIMKLNDEYQTKKMYFILYTKVYTQEIYKFSTFIQGLDHIKKKLQRHKIEYQHILY